MPGGVPGPCSEHEEEEGRGDGSGDEGGRDDGTHDARRFLLLGLGNGRRGGLDGALEEGDVLEVGSSSSRADGGVVDLANLGASRDLPRVAGVDGGVGASKGTPHLLHFGADGSDGSGSDLGDLTVEDKGAGEEVQGLVVLVNEFLHRDDGGNNSSNRESDMEALAGLDLEGLGDRSGLVHARSGVRDGGKGGAATDPHAFSCAREAGERERGAAGGRSELSGSSGEDWPVGDGDLPHGGEVVGAGSLASETDVVDIGSKSSVGNLPREGPLGGTVAGIGGGGVVNRAVRREPRGRSGEFNRGGSVIKHGSLGVLRAGSETSVGDRDGEGSDGDSTGQVSCETGSLDGNLVDEVGGIHGNCSSGGNNSVGPLQAEIRVGTDNRALPASSSVSDEVGNSREGAGARCDIDLDGQVEVGARLDNDVAEAGSRGGEAPGGNVEAGGEVRELITGHLSDESGASSSASAVSSRRGTSRGGDVSIGKEGEGRESESVGTIGEVEADLGRGGNVDSERRSLLPASNLSGGIVLPTVVTSSSRSSRHASVGPAVCDG